MCDWIRRLLHRDAGEPKVRVWMEIDGKRTSFDPLNPSPVDEREMDEAERDWKRFQAEDRANQARWAREDAARQAAKKQRERVGRRRPPKL